MKPSSGDDAPSLPPRELPEKLDTERPDASVFDLLLQIEARLRAEARDELKLEKGRRPRPPNLSQDHK